MNRTVGNYRIVEQLGEGAMGAVYRAVDIHLDREVALKSVRREVASQPEFVERFREEAKIQARLESPHIVRVYQFLREGDEFFMVMEFVKGRSLSETLKDQGRLAPENAISIIAQVLDGLEYAHRRNVVHRDIKPANIMLSDEGVVKVADFGIARVLGSSRERLTQIGGVVGTLEYMSPETLMGEDATGASDLYSCGIVAYQLLTGRVPFKHKNDWMLVEMHRNTSPPPLRDWVPDIPKPLEAAVLRALSKKPQERFSSAGEMANVLRSWLQSSGGPTRTEAGIWDKLRSLTSSSGPEDTIADSSQDSAEGSQRRAAISAISRRVEELIFRHDWQEAQRELEQRMAAFPGDTTLRELHDRIARERRFHEEGLQLALQEGQSLLKRGLPELAKTALETSLSRYPNHPELTSLLQQAAKALSEHAAGSSEVTKVAERVSELLSQEQFQEAVQYIVDAVGRLPNHPELATLLSRTIRAAKEHTTQQEVEACRREVHSFQESGDWQKAFEAIDRLSSRFPNEPRVSELRAATERDRQSRLREAEIQRSLVQVAELREKNQLAAAEELLVETLAQFPGVTSVGQILSDVRADKEQARRRTIVEAAIERARVLREKAEWDQAREVISAALREAPGDARLEGFRSETQQLQDQAAAALQAAIENGKALLEAKRFEDALMALSEISQRYPNEPTILKLLREAQQNLAAERRERQLQQISTKVSELLARGSFEEAEHILLDAISQFPDDARLSRNLSAAIQGRRDREKKKVVGECLERARSHSARGNLQAAIEEIESGLARYPAEPLLEEPKRDLSAKLREQHHAARLAELNAQMDEFLIPRNFQAGLDAVSAALKEYPEDPDFLSLHTAVRNAERSHAQQAAEADAKQRIAELEKRNEYDAAFSLLRTAIALYPDSSRLAGLRSALEERWQAAARTQKIQLEEAEISRLLNAGDLRASLERSQRAMAEFPDNAAFATLREQTEIALRRASEQEIADVVEKAIAAMQWPAAESAVGEFERQGGSSSFSAGLRDQITSARQARKKQFDKSLGDVRSRIKRQDFAGALELLRGTHPNETDAESVELLIKEAQNGLQQQGIDQALQHLADRIGAALKRGDLAEANDALQDAHADLNTHPAYREWEIKVRREHEIVSVVGVASARVAEREWSQAIELLEKAGRELGEDPRISDLAALALREQQEHERAVQAILTEVRTLSDAGEFENAMARLTAARAQMPHEAALDQALAETQQRMPAFRHAAKLRSIEAAAESLLSSKQWERAESILQEALIDLPGEGVLLGLLQKAQAELQRIREIEACAKAVRDHLQANDPAGAEQILAEGLRQFPDSDALSALRDPIGKAAEELRTRAIEAALFEAQTERSEQHFEAATRLLTGALQEHGEDRRLKDAIAETEDAKRRKIAEEIREVQALRASAGPEAALARISELGAEAQRHPDIKKLTESLQRELKKSKAAQKKPIAATPSTPAKVKPELELPQPLPTQPDVRPIAKATPIAASQGAVAKKPLPWKLIGGAIAAAILVVLLISQFSRKPAVGFSSVGIRSDPPGASVKVGDKSCTTPECNLSLAPGNYQIEVQLDGYAPVQRALTITAGKNVDPIDVTLQPIPSPLAPGAVAGTKQPIAPVAPVIAASPKTTATAPSPTPSPAIPPALPPSTPVTTATTPPKQVDLAEQDWERVKGTTDPAQVQAYLDRHPGGPHTTDALSLEDNLMWSRTNPNDAASLRAYTSRFPRGTHAPEASARLAELAWKNVDQKNEQQLRDFIAQNSDNPHRPEAQRLLDQFRADADKAKQAAEDRLKQKEAGERLAVDKQNVLLALQKCEAAYRAKNLDQAKAVFPSISDNAAVVKLFKSGDIRSLPLQLAAQGEIHISGDSATVQVKRSLGLIYRGGDQPQPNIDTPTVNLRRSGQGWVIVSIM